MDLGFDKSMNLKVTAVAAELNYSLPKEIHMLDILLCSRVLVKQFEEIRTAHTDEAREKLLN